VPHDSQASPSFDERTTALSNGSRRILETVGVWGALASAATPIRKIHVSDQGHFGFARVDAAEQGLSAMGFVVPNRAMGAALWGRIAGMPDLRVFCPAEVLRVTANDRSVELDVVERGIASTIRTRLVVAADGIHSAVRSASASTPMSAIMSRRPSSRPFSHRNFTTMLHTSASRRAGHWRSCPSPMVGALWC